MASEHDVARWLAESGAAATAGASDAASSTTPGASTPTRPPQPDATDPSSALRERLGQANAAYRARRWTRAFDAYQAIVATEPGHALAWFRIGNLHQRRGQWLQAASAYRRAARDDGVLTGAPDASVAALDEVRAKASVNLAIVNLELAEAALAQIDRLPSHLAGARDAVAAAVERVRAAVRPVDPASPDRGPSDALTSRASAPPAAAPAGASSSAGPPPTAPARLSARPAATPGTVPSASSEVPSRRDARPTIEYLQGAPKP